MVSSASSVPPFEKPWGNYALEKIVETQAPEQISWLPQTLGWQITFIVLVLFTFKKAYQSYKSYQANRYRREALKWLKQFNSLTNQSNQHLHYRQLPSLLRKTALCAFNRNDITLLAGASWEQWLDAQCPETSFHQSCPDLLSSLAFQADIDLSDKKLPILIEQITLWVKFHRRQHD